MTRAMTQRIRDPVHGLIVFGGSGDKHRDETDRIAWRLLNAREFQRLRRIRQLGLSDLVFPGATHSRFAHSIGVYHTARRLAKVIARRQDERDPDRERIALLAALLHDVGHGPFSHAFEAAAGAAGKRKRHEDWSVEIIQSDTHINHVLCEVDAELPKHIGALLKEEEPKDVYAAIVSSQFDADRLDYIQRDRMATGVEFGHIDRDWLFDCLGVGSVTIGKNETHKAPCLYLGPKGVSVAEEYLQARFRLYQMVYMHKTTRAAEKMLEKLLSSAAAEAGSSKSARREPILRYLTDTTPPLGTYLDLDDAAVWSTLPIFAARKNPRISKLAKRLRDRDLYKCVDVGTYDEPDGNLFLRFQHELENRSLRFIDDVLFDEPTVALYKWYDFDDASALNKVLVKERSDVKEPRDIAGVSSVVGELRGEERIQRVYAPEQAQVDELHKILEEVRS